MKRALEPFKEIKVKDTKIQQKAQEREELKKTIEEDRKVADDENEQPSVRQRARERVAENTERDGQLGQEQNQLEQEREQIVERLPLRERLKDLFKKHGFTLATVVTAVGITIGVIAKILADGASTAANGIKTVGKKVGDGVKELGKKIGSIVPGLVGAIASFVFRAAGQAITFLGKNAWLFILFEKNHQEATRIRSLLARPENKAYKNERTKTHKCLVYVMRICCCIWGWRLCLCLCCLCICGWCLWCCCICYFCLCWFLFNSKPLGFCCLFVDWILGLAVWRIYLAWSASHGF